MNIFDVLSNHDIDMFKALSKVQGGLVILSCEQRKEKLKGVAYSEISLYSSYGKKKSIQTIKEEFKNIVQKQNLTHHIKSIKECAALAKKIDIVIDEENEECRRGRELANGDIAHFKSKESNKDKLFPLQGEKLWRQLARENKQLHRLPFETSSGIEKHKQEKRKCMEEIRHQQWKEMSSLSLLVSKFFSNVIHLESGEEAVSYYFYWIKLILDDRSRGILQRLYPQYTEEKKKEPTTKKKLQGIVNRMIAASTGLEHFMREFGQMYETAQVNKDDPSAGELVEKLPKIAANFLLLGYPFEIMDGDASHVPIHWVIAVLEEVKRRLDDPKVLVVSVLGVQSTGKSTLLNTVFGLQFSVSAGRCTRGVFMQLVSLDEKLSKKMKYSHILVIDTEGLRAPELSSEMSNVHDNEIATFVIGIANVTIVNMFGEAFAEMQDILQTVVHALLRMKEVKKMSRVVFVHQNVTALSARERGDQGRLKFRESLDKMTCLAAKEERCERKYKSFNVVIMFKDDEDVFHFPSLWKGDPPLAPVNPGYSDKASVLKSHILKTHSHQSMSSFLKHLQDVWKAILFEDFVFSFKNTVEVAAYSSLEKALSQWQWKLETKMLAWEQRAKNLIQICEFEEAAQREIIQKQLSKVKEISKQWESEIAEDRRKFFGCEYKEILVQWKAKTDIRLKELQKEKREDAERFCGIQYTYRAGREDVKRRQILHQQMILAFIKELLKTLENQITSEELRSHFDKEWEKWMEEIPSICSYVSEKSIKQRIEDSMKTKFFNVKNELSKKGGLTPVTDAKLIVQPYHIEGTEFYLTGYWPLNKFFSYLTGQYEKVMKTAQVESDLIVGKAVSLIYKVDGK